MNNFIWDLICTVILCWLVAHFAEKDGFKSGYIQALYDTKNNKPAKYVVEEYEKLSRISRLFRLVFHGHRRPIYNKVVIHFDDGDWETTAINGIIYVPWWARKLKMKLEDDGTVTLADKYFAGYGKQYGKTTWEYVK